MKEVALFVEDFAVLQGDGAARRGGEGKLDVPRHHLAGVDNRLPCRADKDPRGDNALKRQDRRGVLAGEVVHRVIRLSDRQPARLVIARPVPAGEFPSGVVLFADKQVGKEDRTGVGKGFLAGHPLGMAVLIIRPQF